MAKNNPGGKTPTRRGYVEYGGVLAGGALAGCTGGDPPCKNGGGRGSCSVTIEPIGKNDRLYMGADPSQGPILNLFNTEMLAKQLYPGQFGEWKGIGEHTDAERLFDRQRVADMINGDI